MDLIPAIDLIGGSAVRLVRGNYDQPIETTADPVSLAAGWVRAGARRLHLVDLEAARSGRAHQTETIRQVVVAARAAQAGARIQAGGGLRSLAAVEDLLAAGVDDVVLGSAALADPRFLADCAARWPGRVGAALDLRHGRPAVEGWRRELDIEADVMADRLVEAGASRLVVTDIERDGTGSGPNLELLEDLRARLPGVELISSGGVATTAHLRQLAVAGVDAAIVGRALLEGRLSVPDALAACQPLVARW
jgi:phosphoribosylformimino-5-aminoimidazole carboxamide ribotide isomerase